MFKTAMMMAVAITYQTIVVVFKLDRSLSLHSIVLQLPGTAFSYRDYSFSSTISLFTVAFTGVILCKYLIMFSLDNFQVFVVSLTRHHVHCHGAQPLLFVEPAASPSNANGTWKPPKQL